MCHVEPEEILSAVVASVGISRSPPEEAPLLLLADGFLPAPNMCPRKSGIVIPLSVRTIVYIVATQQKNVACLAVFVLSLFVSSDALSSQ